MNKERLDKVFVCAAGNGNNLLVFDLCSRDVSRGSMSGHGVIVLKTLSHSQVTHQTKSPAIHPGVEHP